MNKEKREESWNFIDLQADYKRMGVPNNLWVTTAVNGEYRVSLQNNRSSALNIKRSFMVTPPVHLGPQLHF